MGTRSLTYVYEDDSKKAIMCMYRQFDGYPDGHGQELVDFLEPFTVVNGFNSNMKEGSHANGAGCLAAQLVKHFKNDIGGIYLMEPKEKLDAGQEYIYKIRAGADGGISLETYDSPWKGTPKLLFKGTPAEVRAWIPTYNGD